MSRILIAGCGYLGQAIGDLFYDSDWEVEGWTSSAASAAKLWAKPYRISPSDLSDADALARHSGSWDVVIQSASTRGGDASLYRRTYLQGARNLVERFPDSRIVFVSSTSVYAQTGGEWVKEESVANPEHDTGKVLREAEEVVLNHRGVVARLAGLYGPGRAFLLTRVLSGEAVMDSQSDRYVNQVHRDDAAAAVFLLANRPSAAGAIYNVVDDEPILRSECYRWLATRLNLPLPAVGRSAVNPKRGRSNKRVSNAKLQEIGWAPRYPTFARAMEESILPSFNLGPEREKPVE